MIRETDVPKAYLSLYRKALSGKSRKAAIRCHCLYCMGWQAAEVARCTAPTCPLYPYLKRGVSRAESTISGGMANGTGESESGGLRGVLR